MKLSEYPRPPADNGRGIHWSPSQYQWGHSDWLKWQKRILELGFKWIKVNVPPDYNAEALVKRLIDIDVMPVCRFISKNPSRIGGSIEASIGRLIDLGARYFETNNEPDADVEWKGFHRPPHWEEIVINNLVHDAHLIQKMGGFPAFVAFNSSPTESRNPIEILIDHPEGKTICEKGMWVSLHNYGKGRPFNYPNDRVRMFGDPVSEDEWLNQGQPESWSDAETVNFVWHNFNREKVNQLRQAQKDPNITIMKDITGFRAYEYWHTLISEAELSPLPIMMTEGGWETGDRLDAFYPEPTAQRASDLNFQMFKFIQGDVDMTVNLPNGDTESTPVPDYLFAVMPWHIGERAFGFDTSGQWEQGAWFTHWYDKKFNLNGELPIVQMLRDLPSKVRSNGPTPPAWQTRKHLAATVPEWDHRLMYLGDGITIKHIDSDAPYWQVISGLWQDKNELNPIRPLPQGYIMVKVVDENDDPIPNARVEISRGNVTDTIHTKGWLDGFLGNYRMSGTLGTYRLRVSHKDFASDEVIGLGLGGEFPNSNFDMTSFLITFKLTNATANIDSPPLTDPDPLDIPTPPPSDTPTPPADVPAPPETPDTSIPPADVPAPPETSINDAETLGVTITPVVPQEYCEVASIHRVTAADRLAPGTLFADVIDMNGNRVFNAVILLKNQQDERLRLLIEKPLTEPGGNMTMWAHNTYRVTGIEIRGKRLPVETIDGLRANIPNHGDRNSFLIVYHWKKITNA